MKDGNTTRGGRSFWQRWRWVVALFICVCGWQIWEFHAADTAYRNAVREAQAAGFTWTCEDIGSLIRQDWRNAFKKKTWGPKTRVLKMGGSVAIELGRHREMLRQLGPTGLEVGYFTDANVDSLKECTGLYTLTLSGGTTLQNVDDLQGLTGLRNLLVIGCPALQNVDGLKGLAELRYLDLSGCSALQNVHGLKGRADLGYINLSGCSALQNVDGLKGLTSLDYLDLSACTALQNVDGLDGLTKLERIDLMGCTALQNVDRLKRFTGLRSINIRGCEKISAAALRDLRIALPAAGIFFPDGTVTPSVIEEL